MDEFHIQIRRATNGPLEYFWCIRARSRVGAIINAAQQLARMGDTDVCEIVATISG